MCHAGRQGLHLGEGRPEAWSPAGPSWGFRLQFGGTAAWVTVTRKQSPDDGWVQTQSSDPQPGRLRRQAYISHIWRLATRSRPRLGGRVLGEPSSRPEGSPIPAVFSHDGQAHSWSWGPRASACKGADPISGTSSTPITSSAHLQTLPCWGSTYEFGGHSFIHSFIHSILEECVETQKQRKRKVAAANGRQGWARGASHGDGLSPWRGQAGKVLWGLLPAI